MALTTRTFRIFLLGPYRIEATALARTACVPLTDGDETA
jgi:hypothetical protein